MRRLVGMLVCLLAVLTAACVPAVAGAAPASVFAQPFFAATAAGGSALAPTTAPANTVAPVISGATRGGSPLVATAGAWNPSGTSYAFQWQRDTGSGYADIPGATSAAYTTVAADVTATIRVAVTASNALGDTTTPSADFGPIGPGAPIDAVLPTISAAPRRGQPVAANAGAWNPAGTTYAFQWQHDVGSGFVVVAGATTSSYTPPVGDVGHPLRVVVTATNGFGAIAATSAATAAVIADPPVDHAVPVIAGTARRASVLTASAGTWTPTGATFAFQWQRDTGSGFADISGATGASYTLATADVGAHVRVTVTATNPDGPISASSAATATIAAAIPASTVAPAVAGPMKLGGTVTASPGAWNPAATSYAYQWQRGAGTTWADIAGATSASYTLVAADVGSSVRVAVTATNADGHAVASSAPGLTVTAPPVLSAAIPAPTGTLMDTNMLTATTGTWTAATGMTYTYQWLRCPAGATSAATGCSSIGPGPTYVLTGADAGHTIAVRVTAFSGTSAAADVSLPTATIAGRPLTNVRPVAISGTIAVAQTVREVPGLWSVPLTAARYQWVRCAADGTGCADVSGATSVAYLLTLADAGHALAVREDVTSPGRTASVTTTPVAVADQPAPVATTTPTITGVVQRTNSLTLHPGTWINTTRLSYAWERCAADGTGCAAIAGETGTFHVLVAADVARTITVAVTATNSAGSLTVSAPLTGVVAKMAPELRMPPVVAGVYQVPNTMQANRMSWKDTSDTRYAFQWQRCDGAGASCTDIAGATAQSYRLATADARATLRVVETATNSDGAVPASSDASPVIKPAVPAITTYPHLAAPGRPVVGVVSTLTPGVWSAATEITTKVKQFWRCKPVCAPISGSTGTTYTLASADAGGLVRASETATGPGGTLIAWSPTWLPVLSSTTGSQTLSAGASATVSARVGVALADVSVGNVVASASVARAAEARKPAASAVVAGAALARAAGVRPAAESVSLAQAAVAGAAARQPAAAAAKAVGPLRVVLRRRGPASRRLKAWACVTPPQADVRQPCTKAVVLHARTVIKLTIAKGQRVLVMVARRQ